MQQFTKGFLYTFLVLSLFKIALPLAFAAKVNKLHKEPYTYKNEIHFSIADLESISNIISGAHQSTPQNNAGKKQIATVLPQVASFIKLETSRRHLDKSEDNAVGNNEENGLYQSTYTPKVEALNTGAGSYLGYFTPVQSTILNFIGRYNKRLTPPQVAQISNNILEMSSLFRVDPQLVTGLIAVESSFNPYAISTTGAMGLGQLKPDTAEWLGIQDPFDPRQNVYASTKYLRYLLDRYQGNVQLALAAYYKGQGAVDRQGLDTASVGYVNRIAKAIEQM